MAKVGSYVMQFSGPPAQLVARVELPRAGRSQACIIVGPDEFPLTLSGDDKMITELAFALPPETLPGELKCRVVISEAAFDAIVEVQPRSRVRVEPAGISLTGRAGETVTTTLNVSNRGNTALPFHADETVTLRPAGTLASSVKSAFKLKDRDFAARVIALGEKIAEAPSHQAAVAGTMAGATLETGANATVTLQLEIPGALKAGTAWTGSLGLLGSRVRIDVATGKTG